jgi:hypothetical protein
MMFPVVMTEATTIYAMQMKMTTKTMCTTKMVKRLPTTLLLVVMSTLLLKGHRTTFLDSPRKCSWNKGGKSIFQKDRIKT